MYSRPLRSVHFNFRFCSGVATFHIPIKFRETSDISME